MIALPEYSDFNDKIKTFGKTNFSTIETIKEFNNWYAEQQNILETNLEKEKSFSKKLIYRGVTEAKYKLYSSSQRFWIGNNIEEKWQKSYLDFINTLVYSAREKKLFNKVFEFHNLNPNQRDFPILSILQHYGAPTPLTDFTYDLDIALFFATQNKTFEIDKKEINNYFSIYWIDNNYKKTKIPNLLNLTKGSYPRLNSVYSTEQNSKSIFYISDLEEKLSRPITTIYNQNIIPQQGLFVFNPFSEKPLEDCLKSEQQNSNNLETFNLINCININKSLINYIQEKNNKKGINSSFVYPNLNLFCKTIIDDFIKTIN